MKNISNKLSDMSNIGPVLERQLREVGITTPDELRQAGSREAWLKILQHDPSACVNRLMGLEGAIQNIRWHHLEPQTKKALGAFVKKHKSTGP